MSLSRRELMQLLSSGALLGATGAMPALAAGDRRFVWRNWSGAQTCIPADRVAPTSESALAELVAQTRHSIRPVGAAHSFSPLIPTDGTILSLNNLSGMICYDSKANTADFWAGTRLTDMGAPLHAAGQGLVNMPDIDYQTLAGAIGTSTHGTGQAFGSLSSYVKALRLVTASGDTIDCSADENADVFNAARASFGALGVLTRVTMQNRPRYKLVEKQWLQNVWEALEDIDNLVRSNRHFELMPLIHSDTTLAVTLNETDREDTPVVHEDSGAYVDLLKLVDRYVRDYPDLRNVIMNAVGSLISFDDRVGWSYRIFANTRTVRWNEMEYQVPAEAGPDCLREILTTIKKERLNSWFPLEYRYVKGDDIWLSQFQGRDSCSISVHQYYEQDYHAYFDRIERIFWKYDGRPHWGKLHQLNHRQLRELYPHWQDFQEVRASLDPQGKFLNGHLETLLGVESRLRPRGGL